MGKEIVASLALFSATLQNGMEGGKREQAILSRAAVDPSRRRRRRRGGELSTRLGLRGGKRAADFFRTTMRRRRPSATDKQYV